MGLNLQDVRFRLGAAFAILLAVLAVFGWYSVSRLQRLNAQIQNAVYARWAEEGLVREAFRLSDLNNRISLVIFLLDDTEEIQRLIAERAANTQRISELIRAIKPTLRAEKEKRLLAAVETARKPYIESHLQALALLLTEHKRDEARRMVIEVTLPLLTLYQDAWLAFVRCQSGEIEQAMQRKASFAEARQRFLFLTVFAGLVTMAIIIIVFMQISGDVAALQHEHAWLERRVQARTTELEEASKKAQASETRYRALFEGSSDAIMTLDASHFLDCNEATLKMFGCASKKEFITLHPADVSPLNQPSVQDSRVAADQRIAEALAKGTASFEWVYCRRNGENFPADVLLTALEVGGQKVLQATVRDISERQKAQKALAASESRYRRLFEAAKDGVLILDAETGKIEDVNPFLVELLGYTREQFIGKRLWELGSLKDIVANQANFAELQQKQYIRYEDKPLQTADGQRRQVEFVSNVYTVDSRKVIQCNIRDVTEHIRMEEQSRRLVAIVRSADDAIFGKTLDGIITSWNRGAERIYGYTENEIVGKSISILIPPDREYELAMILEKVRRGEHITRYETVRRRKDGSTIDVSLSISPVCDAQDKIIGVSTVARDITAHKQAEEQLRLQSHALQAAANGIVITDTDGKIEWANNAFTRLTGYTIAEVIGQNPRFLKSGEQDTAFYREMWDTILAGQVWHGELVNKRKDGSFYTEEMTITPVAGDPGQVNRFIAIKQDVTVRRQLEKDLLQSQKMEAIGRLAGGVAHDFNNILTAIIGYGERTIKLLGPDEPLRENIKQITEAAERAAVLTRQLLAFSRKQVFQPMVLDMNVVITGC
jgi:PAS domain S-box-containing protein